MGCMDTSAGIAAGRQEAAASGALSQQTHLAGTREEQHGPKQHVGPGDSRGNHESKLHSDSMSMSECMSLREGVGQILLQFLRAMQASGIPSPPRCPPQAPATNLEICVLQRCGHPVWEEDCEYEVRAYPRLDSGSRVAGILQRGGRRRLHRAKVYRKSAEGAQLIITIPENSTRRAPEIAWDSAFALARQGMRWRAVRQKPQATTLLGIERLIERG